MGKPAHRHDDLRVCGATTVVVGQSTVTIAGKLWAVKDDIDSHGNGQLKNTTGSSVTIVGKPVIVHGPDEAQQDDLCPFVGEPHCNPKTQNGSTSVFCYP